jgi:hypothetical protein
VVVFVLVYQDRHFLIIGSFLLGGDALGWGLA